MSEGVVNLRQARKRRDRAEAEKLAAENRARHGRSKAERETQAKRSALAAAALDGHKLEKP
jgi:hypothetical protein